MYVLHPHHMTVPMHTVCHSQSISCFKPNFIFRYLALSIFELCSTHCSHHRYLSTRFPSCFLSDTMLYFHAEILAFHGIFKQTLSAFEETSSHAVVPHMPKLDLSISCSASRNSLIFSTCAHPAT